MFATVEKYRGSAKLLLGLISITFIGFGVSTVASPDSDFIVKVGSQKVGQNDVRREMEAIQASGKTASNQSVFNNLLQQAYLLEGAAGMGIGVSLEQLKKVIVDDPTFHDESGKFSQQKFNEYLSARQLTEDRFIEQIRRQFELQNVLNLAQSGSLVSDAQVQQLAGILEAQRIVRTTAFDARAFLAGVKTDDAALKAYFDKNKADYTLPQAVKFQYIALSADSLLDKQTVSEAELKQAFEESQKTAQAQREVAHIMFLIPQGGDKAKIKAEAEKVLAMVQAKPAQFAQLAKQYSQDTASAKNGGSLGVISQQGWPQAFSDEAFRLNKGETSNLVETPEGFHIIRVLDIKNKASFDEAKAQLTEELKRKKAQQAVSKMRTVLEEEAFATPDSLDAVAKKTGLKIEQVNEWISKQEAEQNQMPSELVAALFGDEVFKKKHNSEPIAVKDQIWVVRASETRAETAQPFEAVKEQVKQAYIVEQANAEAQKKAKQALGELQAGKPAALSWSPSETMTLEQARRTMPPQAFDALLKARPANGKPAYALLEGLPVPVIVEVAEIKAPQLAEEQTKALRNALTARQSETMLDRLLAYLQRSLPQKQGAQQLDEDKQ